MADALSLNGAGGVTGSGARFRTGSGERGVLALLAGAGAVGALCLAGILGFLIWFSLPLLEPGQLAAVLSWTWQPTSGLYGILPMAVGSLLLGSSALALAYPVGLGLALFVNGLGPDRAARPLSALVRLMTGVPTVVYGLASAFLLVPLVRAGFAGSSGFSWLSAALVLALLVLPTIVLLLDSQLRLVLPGLGLTAAALGLSRAQTLVRLALPLCGPGLKSAAVLGFGRAVGDTLIPLMLSGNAAQLPHSPLDSLRALTAHIGLVLATDSQSTAYGSLFACGLLLFCVSLAVNAALHRLRPASAHEGVRVRLGAGLERAAGALAWTSAILAPAAVCALLGFLLVTVLGTRETPLPEAPPRPSLRWATTPTWPASSRSAARSRSSSSPTPTAGSSNTFPPAAAGTSWPRRPWARRPAWSRGPPSWSTIC